MSKINAVVMMVMVAGLVQAAEAGVLNKPNGNFAGGVQSVTSAGVTVTAMIPSYSNCGDPAGLMPALQAQSFTWSACGLQDNTFRLDRNGAWADTAPAMNFYGMNIGASVATGLGGSQFAVAYQGGAVGAPAAADARWLQVIRTNSALAWGNTHGVGLVDDVGFTWYIDNGWTGQSNPPSDPFYGADDNINATGYAANGQGLLDRPSRVLADGVVWEAWAMISTRDVLGNITVWDGVHWGFTMTAVPTPATLALGAVAGVFATRRRRNA